MKSCLHIEEPCIHFHQWWWKKSEKLKKNPQKPSQVHKSHCVPNRDKTVSSSLGKPVSKCKSRASLRSLQSKRKISASENGACLELARNISITGCGECNFKVLKSMEFWKQLLKFVSKSDLTSPVSDVYKWHTPLNHICTQCMNSHILDFPFQL